MRHGCRSLRPHECPLACPQVRVLFQSRLSLRVYPVQNQIRQMFPAGNWFATWDENKITNLELVGIHLSILTDGG